MQCEGSPAESRLASGRLLGGFLCSDPAAAAEGRAHQGIVRFCGLGCLLANCKLLRKLAAALVTPVLEQPARTFSEQDKKEGGKKIQICK